jgi:hypothetical protein
MLSKKGGVKTRPIRQSSELSLLGYHAFFGHGFYVQGQRTMMREEREEEYVGCGGSRASREKSEERNP